MCNNHTPLICLNAPHSPFPSLPLRLRPLSLPSPFLLSLSSFFSGAYYYYHTETGKNYQQTMLDVKAYVIDQAKLPVRAFQFDSWWYTRGSGPNGGGVVLW